MNAIKRAATQLPSAGNDRGENNSHLRKDRLGLGVALRAMNRIVLFSLILLTLPGCVVVGGYSSEGGWFLWPGTIVIFVVALVLFFLFKRRK